jgi:hypothetical protein
VLLSLAVGSFLARGGVSSGGAVLRSEAVAMNPSLPRVTFVPAAASVGSVVGAEWVEPATGPAGHLYLLDASLAQVVILEEDASGWRQVAAFGSEGSGPGELRWPQDILWVPESEEVLVLSRDGRIHHFTKDGSHLRDESARFPCTLARGTLARRPGGGVWVAGDCSFPATSGDTVFAVVLGEDRDGTWRVFARKPRFTLDGRFGSVFGLRRPVASNESATFLNAGNDLCFQVVEPVGSPGAFRELTAVEDALAELCLQGRRYRAPEPADFPSRRLPPGRAFSWPDPLPSHSAMAASGNRLFLLRMVSADSVFLEARRVDAPEHPGEKLAVGPIQGLVGCRSWGCLWFRPDAAGGRVGLLRFPGQIREEP